jgi:protein disulfide-isomerase A1
MWQCGAFTHVFNVTGTTMNYLGLCLLWLAACLDIAVSESVSPHITILTADTLKTHTDSHAATLVAFHAPWCGHCKALAPKFDETAEKISHLFPTVSLATLDADSHKEVASQFQITGFPSLRWFVPGAAPIEYDSDRSVDAMVAWVSRQINVKAVDLSSVEVLDTFMGENAIAVLVGFPNAAVDAEEDHGLAEVLAKTFEFPVGMFEDDTVWEHLHEKFGIERDSDGDEDATVFMFREFDKVQPLLKYEDELDAPTIKKFVNVNILPHVVDFTEKVSKYIFASAVKKHVLLFSDKAYVPGDALYDVYHRNAVSTHGEILSIIVGDDAITNGISSFFSVAASDRPCIYGAEIIQGSAPIKYKGPTIHDDDTDDAFISTFFEEFGKGTLTKYVKSQDISEMDGGDTGVVQMNVETFSEIAASDRGFLVLFYSPGCGHCVAMHPIWDKLGKSFGKNTDIVIAKIDVVSNDLPPSMEITSFPTIKLFIPGKATVDFDGTRTVKAIRKFLNTHGFTPSNTAPLPISDTPVLDEMKGPLLSDETQDTPVLDEMKEPLLSDETQDTPVSDEVPALSTLVSGKIKDSVDSFESDMKSEL